MPSLYDLSETTVGDVQTAFRVMTDNAVIAMVADCAAGLRTEWLKIAMDLGVFDFTDEVSARGTIERTSACIEGLMEILGHTETVMLTHDPEFGKLDIPIPTHALSRDAKTMGPFVEALTTRLIKEKEGVVSTYLLEYQGKNEGDAGAKNLLQQANRSLACLMALAAAMDLPKTVQAIRWAVPAAHLEGLPVEWLGQFFKGELVDPTKRLDVAPAFFAVYYSNTEALKGFAPKPKPGKEEGPKAKNFVPMFVEPIDEKTLLRHDAAVMLNHWNASCAPSTLALSWRDRLDPSKPARDDDLVGLHGMACKALGREPNPNLFAPQIPAFEAIGAFDRLPGLTILTAVENGRPVYVERFKGRTPWNDPKFAAGLDTLLLKTVEATRQCTPRDEGEAAMVALMRLAVEDGRQDAFFRTTKVTNRAMTDFLGESIVQPVFSLIEGQFNKVLVGFLDHGMKPNEPMADDAFSPMEVAEALGARDTVNMMVSHTARGRAHSILDEIDLAPFAAKPKP